MLEHVHGCLNCQPEMVPDFDRADPRYHGVGKCLRADGVGSTAHRVFLDDIEIAYTSGIFEGAEGWVLFSAATTADIHTCPCGFESICVEPRFGAVTVVHLGSADA